MRPLRDWLLLILAAVQFVLVALPPGNADLISIQTLALDLARGDASLLYPGRDFANNAAWVRHHEANLESLRARGDPNWCFYPPLVPWLASPFARVNPETWRLVWAAVQCGLLALFVLLIARLLQISGAVVKPSYILLSALVIGSYPVARAVFLGQTTLLIALLAWGGVYASRVGKTVLGAVAMAVAALFKPFVLLATLVDAVHRRFRFALFSAASLAILFALSLAAVGIAAHREYWNLLATLGISQTAYVGNQSVMAGLVRVLTDMPVMDYGFGHSGALTLLGRILAVAILATAAHCQWHYRHANFMASAGLWFSASLLALPVSWEHHLVLLLPVIAWLWTQPLDRLQRRLLGAATLLIAVDTAPLAADAGPGRVIASFPLLGNLLLFSVLILVHWRARTSVPAAVTSGALNVRSESD